MIVSPFAILDYLLGLNQMPDNLDAHVQHAGEGVPSAGNADALAQTKIDPKTLGVQVVTSANEITERGSMGLKGIWRQVGDATAMTVVCAIMVYGIVYVVPQMQEKFNTVVNAEREAHMLQITAERVQAAKDRQADREMYDKHRLLIEDRADTRHEKMETSNDLRFEKLSNDIMKAIRESIKKP